MNQATISRPRLILILGPTGVGKTATAVKLAGAQGGEIINADSMQIYRYMDIGTAKPTPEERTEVKHHLIDCCDPCEPFNASLFIEKAHGIIAELSGARKPIFVVGGTGLYIKALLCGLFDGPASDEAIRSFYKEQLKQHGKTYLYDLLKEKDPRAANLINSNDASRIIRALEVIDLSGESIVGMQENHGFRERRYDALKIGLSIEREELYRRIDERTDRMIADGFCEEVRRLICMGYSEVHKPMRSLGYKHFSHYLTGECTMEEAVRLMKRDTRNYAKRQMTWFSADKEIEWVHYQDMEIMEKKIDAFLNNENSPNDAQHP
ncbi:MAG: tRNA (adenosine(37)-N6)-dimethylallyltransferase MiaA [Deltaproteobacteria bacterium]|nr:tRNA (adenosine(37)-N6)-dimethylallyltransferase MiaA [Deltaproteobacteria bacterium]